MAQAHISDVLPKHQEAGNFYVLWNIWDGRVILTLSVSFFKVGVILIQKPDKIV